MATLFQNHLYKSLLFIVKTLALFTVYDFFFKKVATLITLQ